MKNLVNLMKVVLLSSLLVACKSPSATVDGGTPVVDAAVTDTTTATDGAGNITTTSTAADGTITTTITSADGTSVTTVALPAEVDNLGSAAGVWRGVLIPSDGSLATFYKVMVSPSNRVVMLSENGDSLDIQGSDMMKATSFIPAPEEITINLVEYARENNGEALVDVILRGNLTPQASMKGTYTRGAEAGSFIFIYDPIYENDEQPYFYTQDSAWSFSKSTSGGGKYEVTFVIGKSVRMISVEEADLLPPVVEDADGNITLNPLPTEAKADTEGCIYSGNISIVNPNYVLYNMTMEVTGCALAGEYEGLATLEERFTFTDHDAHDHYNFMTFGLSDGINTINNRLTFVSSQLRT